VWASAAAELLADEGRRSAIGAAAGEAAARFDRSAYAERVLALYERVIAGRS
jgi:glycosyltransferase involved in cell wall biosynthesis